MVTVAQWQARFDEDFPYGALVLQDYGDTDNDVAFLCPRIVVLDMVGAQPSIYIGVFEVGKSWTRTVVSYNKVQDDPVVFAIADSTGGKWQLTQPSKDQADQMATVRHATVFTREYLTGEE